ncbi:AAA family ATPase [Anaerocolumna aminovalerica]|uniref:Nuclease SbcCD subunit C n=2 Tax=Lachnospiraceae TaxID=186803 RepID=A0A1I5HF29_9FIRM|nr:AAA family ATPase [Anaerocolumna aminovalerica]SFO46827.1 Wobble nucleotide-excising tRNase [Anaerocolumna aminovalerica]
MIKSIKMVDCTPYHQIEINECKKINFVFGANGSGKSTISSFLSGRQDQRFASSSVEWDGVLHESIYVYNRAFRNENFQQTIPGVFTMGSATIEDIKALEELKKQLSDVQGDWEKNTSSYKKIVDEDIPNCETRFKEKAWNDILKANENDFQKAFEGYRGSKDKFLGEIKKRIAGIPDHEGVVCQRSQLIERARTLYAEKSVRCNRLVVDIQQLLSVIEAIRTDSIWNTVIVGNEDIDIAALIKELRNSHWVDQGRTYIRLGSKKCPFCQKETIDDDFRNKLEAFFDTEYNKKINQMKEHLTNFRVSSEKILSSIASVVLDEESVSVGKLDIDMYNAKQELLNSLFEDCEKRIEEKIAEPSKKINIFNVSDKIAELQKLLDDANKIIDDHNTLVDKRDTEEEKLKDDIWASVIDQSKILINSYEKELSDLNKAASGIKKMLDIKKANIDKLKAEVSEKGKNITSVQPAIDEINKSLKAYGFTNFTIQPAKDKENHYCIERDDGTMATNTLSEGEETFLSFLYFMQQSKGSTDPNHVADKKIIVLDDPISSLDSTILYIVGAMVKELSKNIRDGIGDVTQLFVLTHNVFFHKEASFIDGQTKKVKDVNYWMIRKDNGISVITSYGMDNPISTSYELLWKELRDNDNLTMISIQNTMRRIIENYYGMLGNKKNEYLENYFSEPEERMIARSLVAWINDGSHSIPDDLYIDSYTDAVPKYKEVFREMFYKSGHKAHYNMMMGIEDTAEIEQV